MHDHMNVTMHGHMNVKALKFVKYVLLFQVEHATYQLKRLHFP
jgi:hypothetical protein